jgi:hypothetical protein
MADYPPRPPRPKAPACSCGHDLSDHRYGSWECGICMCPWYDGDKVPKPKVVMHG